MTPTDPISLDPPAPPTGAGGAVVDLLAEPTFEECVAHHSRYFEDRNADRITLEGIPEGHYIAYYDGRIHDHDADPAALVERVATRLHAHQARIFIHYPWMW
jgi:hypothetical protein